MIFRRLVFFIVCSLCVCSIGQAQYLVTFQGPASVSQDPTVSFFDPATLTPGATLSISNAFQFLSLPDGSEFYFITSNTGAGITVLHPKSRNSTGAVAGQHNIGNFANPLNCGALSPDGSRLVVGENAVHVFDTGSNLDLTPSGIGVGAGALIIGVTVSYDSQNAYALATLNGTSYLATISIAQLAVTNSITLTGTASSLAQGPNGLLYVGLPGQILEINPATLATTPSGTVTVNATPGPLAFTPDGNYLVAANQVYGPQPALLLLNLNNHLVEGEVPFTGLAALAASPLTGTTAVFDSLYVASPYTVYPFSSGGQSLFAMQIGSNGGLVLNMPVIAGITDNAQAAMTLSNDLGVPGRNFPQFLFTVTDGNLDPSGAYSLNRIDPASNLLTSTVFLNSAPGAVAYYAPTFTNNTPSTVLQYGNNQTLLPGGVSLPMVIRVLDQNGLPISGVGINFSPSAGTVNPANTVTGADGYAQSIYTAGSTPTDIGSITVTATAGGAVSQTFAVTVGTGQTIYPAALNVVSGQGQLVLEDTASSSPPSDPQQLVVQAVDANGNPVPSTLVTFTVTSGNGLLLSPSGAGQTVVVAPANSTGQASITFIPPLVGQYRGFEADIVTASVTVPGATSSTSTTISQAFYVTILPLDTQYCSKPPCTPVIPLQVQVLQPGPGAVFQGTAGGTITEPVLVQVYTVNGFPVPNIGVKVSTGNFTTLPNASCAGTNNSGLALTNASGLATCNLVLNGIPGTEPLSISIPGLGYGNGSGVVFSGYTLKILPGAPAIVNILAGNNQVAPTGTKLPVQFLVQVTDAGKNVIPGVPVSYKVTPPGSLSLSQFSTVTSPTGEAIATGTVLAAGGTTITVTVTAGSVSATFTVLVDVTPVSIKIVSGNNQTAPINGALAAPLVVQLLDKSNNPASYAPVVFVGTPAQKLSATSVTADINGMASTMVTSVGPIAGTLTIQAINGAGKSELIAKFSVIVLPPGPEGPSILSSASFQTGIAPGGLVTFVGLGLTPTIQGVVTDPSQMQGYAISFDGIAAPILALVNENGVEQINAQVPFEETPGTTDTVTIQTPQGSATLNNITVSTLAPAIFTNGTLAAFGQNYPLASAVRPDGSAVSASNPAQPGENITFYATGLGQTVPAASTGVLGLPGQLVGGTIYAGVNNQGDAVVSAIYEPNALGVYAITIQIPATTAPGPAQPLGLTMLDVNGNAYNAPPVYLPIQ